MFRLEASPAYHERIFTAFLDRWVAAYGKERCMLVLAATMQQREHDARFVSPPSRPQHGLYHIWRWSAIMHRTMLWILISASLMQP